MELRDFIVYNIMLLHRTFRPNAMAIEYPLVYNMHLAAEKYSLPLHIKNIYVMN